MESAPSARRIIDQIRTAKQLYVGSLMLLPMLNDDLIYGRLKETLFPHADTNLRLLRNGADTPYDFRNYGPLVEGLRNNPQFNLDYSGLLLQSMVSQIGDGLKQNGYFAKTQELEFYRHVRNALSHGNRFHFANGEPRRPASFGGRTLLRSQHGQQVFFNYMGPGDVIELWDSIEKYLGNL